MAEDNPDVAITSAPDVPTERSGNEQALLNRIQEKFKAGEMRHENSDQLKARLSNDPDARRLRQGDGITVLAAESDLIALATTFLNLKGGVDEAEIFKLPEVQQLISNASKFGNGQAEIAQEPSYLTFFSAKAGGEKDGLDANASDNSKGAYFQRIIGAAIYKEILKNEKIFDKLDDKQLNELNTNQQAFEAMLAEGKLPKPDPKSDPGKSIDHLSFTAQDALYKALAGEVELARIADEVLPKYKANIEELEKTLSSNLDPDARETFKETFNKLKDFIPDSVFGLFKKQLLGGVREGLDKSGATYTDQQKQGMVDKLDEQLSTPESFHKNAIKGIASALPAAEKDGVPVPDTTIGDAMKAGFEERYKSGLKAGAPLQDRILAIYHKYNPDHDLVEEPNIARDKLIHAVGKHYKLSNTNIGLLQELSKHGRVNREEAAKITAEYALKVTGQKKLPVPFEVLQQGQTGILNYMKNRYGEIGPDGKRQLPYGASFEELEKLDKLEKLEKNPNKKALNGISKKELESLQKAREDFQSKHGMEIFMRHGLDFFSGGLEKVKRSVKADFENSPAIRKAKELRNDPALRVMREARALEHSPATALLTGLEKANKGAKPGKDGKIDLEPGIIQEFIQHYRAEATAANKGEVPPGVNTMAVELSKKSLKEIREMRQKALADRTKEVGLAEASGFAVPTPDPARAVAAKKGIGTDVKTPAEGKIANKNDAPKGTAEPKSKEATPKTPYYGKRRPYRSAIQSEAPAPAASHAAHPHEHAHPRQSAHTRRSKKRIHHHDAYKAPVKELNDWSQEGQQIAKAFQKFFTHGHLGPRQ